jgi:hypothetical protein
VIEDLANAMTGFIVTEGLGSRQRKAVSGHRVLPAHSEPIRPKIFQSRDRMLGSKLPQLFKDGRLGGVAREFLRKPLLEPNRPRVGTRRHAHQTGVNHFVSESPLDGRPGARSRAPGQMDAPIEMAAAPFRGVGGAHVLLAALRDRRETLAEGASKLG